MSDKAHILTALADMFRQWEQLLGGLSEEQITAPQLPASPLAIKDEITHLWAWQQRTIARVEAALLGQEPAFPSWPAGLDPEQEENTDRINAWIDETGRDRPWPEVYQAWRAGFLRLLELAETVPEPDLLGVGNYPWLPGYSLGAILDASREHHAEHLDELRARADEPQRRGDAEV